MSARMFPATAGPLSSGRASPAALAALCLAGAAALALPASPAREGPHRSPADLVLLPGGRRALTANATADSVSLVDLAAGKVLAEVPCGSRPAAVACSPDGRQAAVGNTGSGTITLLLIDDEALKPAATVPVGPQPRGLAFAGGQTLYAAVAGADEVAAVDLASRKVARRWAAPREPCSLALSPDGRHLAAAAARSGDVYLWETRTGGLVWKRPIEDAFNLRGLAFTPDGRSLVCTHAVKRDFPVSRANIEQGWVIDSRLTRLPLAADAVPPLEQVALDTRGRAVGDPHGLAFDPAGRTLAVTAGGTHEVLLFAAPSLPWSGADPGDFIAPGLLQDAGRFRRVGLGGRPLGLAFLPGGGRVAVANYLLDAVQVVDVRRGTVEKTIPLGGPSQPSPARRGEAFFFDAGRSHDQWFSCATCHAEGHTCGRTFDTLNDDSYGNPKLTPSLRGVSRTGPWTWHGWQKDLGAAVVKSTTETMFGPAPAPDEVAAVVAFLATLEHPPNPHRQAGGRLSPAAERGAALFSGKARCDRCHAEPEYTSERTFNVKLEPDGSPFPRWNPPSLRGLWERGPYLHDGRAATLIDLLCGPHSSEKLGGKPLTPAERDDLIAFLLSL
jgi:YVTN family beta-propeller protein